MKFYRLWCGQKRYSNWLESEDAIWRLALRHGLAYGESDKGAGLGPLTWIEIGERKYARSKTVPVGRKG
ncbi:MAG: hypothetical protein AB7G24_00255 [Novosphingobium sp.]|nr:hypothetical protein [Novosphingobium sp.]